MIQKARKKPVEVECVQFTDLETGMFIVDWVGYGDSVLDVSNKDKPAITLVTLEGVMRASMNDYIVKGVHGEFYPVKPDIFRKTYEVLKDES